MLRMTGKVMDGIVAHAREASPIEACGYLAEKDGVVVKNYRLKNTDRSGEHFSMEPEEQFNAVRDMRNRDLKLKAVYHSHPASPARPSAEDVRLACDPHVSYVIISLLGDPVQVKSFLIKAEEVRNEPIELTAEIQTEREAEHG